MEDPLFLPEADQDPEVTLVTELRRKGRSEEKRISLLGHCLFCLRRAQVHKIQNELLTTVNWVWAALQRRNNGGGPWEEEDGDIFGVGENWVDLEKISKFSSNLKLCGDCVDKMTGLDKLLNKVREEIGELGSWIAGLGAKERALGFQGNLSSSQLNSCRVSDTLKFIKDFRQLFEVPAKRGIDIDSDYSSGPVINLATTNEIKAECGASSFSGSPVPVKIEVEDDEDYSGDRDYGSDLDFPEFDDQDEDESSEDQSSSEDEDDEGEDYVPTSKRARIESPSPQKNQNTPQKEADNPPEPSKPQQPLKIKIPPGYTSSVKRDDTGKPIYLIVTNPINNRDYWICVLDSCGESFMGIDNHTSFERHKNEKHSKNAVVTTVEWSAAKELADQLPWKRIENQETGGICKTCGFKCTDNSAMKGHLKSKHNIVVEGPLWGFKNNAVSPIPCDLCQLKLPPLQLLEHLKEHVGDEYIIRCPNSECLFACIRQDKMEFHLKLSSLCRQKSVGDFKQYKISRRTCPQCGIYCGPNLRTHLLQEHETLEKNFPCPVSGCKMKFSLRLSVVLHFFQHDVQRQVESQPCLQCDDKKKIGVEEMEAHLKEVHGVELVVKCKKCPFVFPSWEGLVDHMFEHRGELVCDICGDSGGKFSRHAGLAQHYFKEHQIGKEYQCEYCPKTFMRMEGLANHVKKDHGNADKDCKAEAKPTFTCEDCGIVFKTKEGLKGHKIKEHGATPFTCHFCSDSFTSFGLLTKHEREVHKGIVPPTEFPCQEPNCGKVFTTKQYLKIHHKSVHFSTCVKNVVKSIELQRI